MHKFVLLFCLMVNYVSADVAEQSGSEEETVGQYVEGLHKHYKDCFMKDVADDTKEIKAFFDTQEQELKNKEAAEQLKENNGYYLSRPSVDCNTGKRSQIIHQNYESRSRINKELQKDYEEVKEAILVGIPSEFANRDYDMKRWIRALEKCGNNKENKQCLKFHGGAVTWETLVEQGFLSNYSDAAFTDVANLAEKKNIALTHSEVMAIAKNNRNISQLMNNLGTERSKLEYKIRSILHPELVKAEEEALERANSRQD